MKRQNMPNSGNVAARFYTYIHFRMAFESTDIYVVPGASSMPASRSKLPVNVIDRPYRGLEVQKMALTNGRDFP